MIVKYRPQRFADFWRWDGPVQRVTQFLRARLLPKCLLLGGDYGTGKTSLARVTGQAISCEGTSHFEPCGECIGCLHPTARMLGAFGAVAMIRGNSFNRDSLMRFVSEARAYPAPAIGYGAYVAIVDEAQRISDKDQESMLDLIEDTPNAHFIFCTTDVQRIIDGIRARARELFMPLPSVEECVRGMRRITSAEGIRVHTSILSEIAHSQRRVPRACIKELEMLKACGEVRGQGQTEPLVGSLF